MPVFEKNTRLTGVNKVSAPSILPKDPDSIVQRADTYFYINQVCDISEHDVRDPGFDLLTPFMPCNFLAMKVYLAALFFIVLIFSGLIGELYDKENGWLLALIIGFFTMFSLEFIVFEKDAKKAKQVLSEADLIFCLDYNSLPRTGAVTEDLKAAKGKKILIDHHISPEIDDFDYVISDVNTSSTGELVYEFIVAMGDETEINKTISECLYTGIITDTGSFSHSCNNAKTYEITCLERCIMTGFLPSFQPLIKPAFQTLSYVKLGF